MWALSTNIPNMSRLWISSFLALCVLVACTKGNTRADLTVIPPGLVSDKVDLDLRCSIVNNSSGKQAYTATLYASDKVLAEYEISLEAGCSWSHKTLLAAGTLSGKSDIVFKVNSSSGTLEKRQEVEVVPFPSRSINRISGAWAGICHWSEEEGKHWNRDIKQLSDNQWREMVRSMHKLGLDLIVIQEVFRNEEYVGKHSTTVENYEGKAYYPSKLYPGRMDIAAEDPVEAIFSEADKLGMKVMPGVGLFAWFDFTDESLKWHKKVARELWDLYGHHESFYGFYVSEESGGSLDNWENSAELRAKRSDEIVSFFKEFKAYCSSFAPAKPIMLATNSFGVKGAEPVYERLLKHLDILCPFGFARMPEGDLKAQEVAALLQSLCDKAGSHLWFDQEVFLFNPDNSLYPRDIEGIVKDLTLLDNFEKVLCYQYPGVFSDPESDFQVGEDRTRQLFIDYSKYLDSFAR